MEEIQDDVLLDLINSNDEHAYNYIVKKYMPLIKMYVKKEMNVGGKIGLDYNDLMQEGMLGLTSAIKTYDKEKDNKFSTFAELVIKRQIRNYIKSMDNNNNLSLNESVSLDDETKEEYIKKLADYKGYPGEKIECDELDKDIKNKLSIQECKVYELKKENKTNKEIAVILNKSDKIIENTVSRINNKIKNMRS